MLCFAKLIIFIWKTDVHWEFFVIFAEKCSLGGDDSPCSSVYIVKTATKKMQSREQQFKELFLSEYGRMYRAAYILLGDEDEARDAVQDVFARLWADDSPLREETTRALLLTCVRNRCLNIIARRNGSGLRAENLELADTIPASDEELIAAVNRYVDERLTPQTGRIIRMHYDDERSYKEISDSLGISTSAVNKHIVQGLRKLRLTFKSREV